MRKLQLKGQKDWREFMKSGNKPDNIPTSPQTVYKNCGWINLGDWLGTGSIAPQNKKFKSFEEAKFFIRKLKLKSFSNWIEYKKSSLFDSSLPKAPHHVYKDQWKGWADFLGKEKK